MGISCAGSLIIVSSLARGEDAPKPSFPCDKAKTLDEKTVCSDARLAQLDRLQAAAYLLARQKNSSEAIKDDLSLKSHQARHTPEP
jgi:uncharacterized protein